MATFNKKSHNRSVSLPARSHPSTVKIEQAVNKIKTWETSSSLNADRVCNCLSGLKELYESIEELLALPLSQSALAKHQQDGRINGLLDESVRYIDICSSSRDKIMLMKEGIRGLQSAFRRRSKVGADSSIENEIAAFVNTKKIIQKEISKYLAKLKHTENKNIPLNLSKLDDQLIIVLRAIAETSFLTMSSFSSLLLFLSAPVSKPQPAKWSLVSKLMYKSALSSEGERTNLNELESIDIALNNVLLSNSCKYDGTEKIESAKRKLEALETIVENLENGLDVLFRHLIRTRVSLLNTFSQ